MTDRIEVIEDEIKPAKWVTTSELSVIKSVCEGKTSKQIAEEIGISWRTVETFRRNAMQRNNCTNIAQLVLLLAREKILL